MYRYSRELGKWLQDLCDGELQQKEIISGYVRFYVLNYCVPNDVETDILYFAMYGSREARRGMKILQEAFETAAAWQPAHCDTGKDCKGEDKNYV